MAPAAAHLKETWQDIQTIGMVYRCREEHGRTSEETMFFISSLPPRVRKLAGHLRGHWGIENSLHWVLDVTFREDDSRIRKGNGPEIASIFRKLALNILKQDTTIKSSIRGKRLQAGWNNDVLEAILAGFNNIYMRLPWGLKALARTSKRHGQHRYFDSRQMSSAET